MSPSGSAPAQPMRAHVSCGSGSVTMRELFIGSQSRRCPASSAVKPSVARITYSAVTVPYGVVAAAAGPPGERGRIAVTGVPSKISTPRRAAAAASPRASFPGCALAQCGLHAMPWPPATLRRAPASAAVSNMTSPGPQPQCASSATMARSLASWAALVAT
jgi:hypothetical protein